MVILLQGIPLFPMQSGAGWIGIYERSNGEQLFLMKSGDSFYLADLQVIYRIYPVSENEEQVNFAGWGLGIALIKDENGNITNLVVLDDGKRLYTKNRSADVPRELYGHAVFSLPDHPYGGILSFCVGTYESHFCEPVCIEQRGDRLFLVKKEQTATLKLVTREIELFPQVSNKEVSSIAIFCTFGCNVIFELDLAAGVVKTMSVFTQDNENVFERSSDSDTGEMPPLEMPFP